MKGAEAMEVHFPPEVQAKLEQMARDTRLDRDVALKVFVIRAPHDRGRIHGEGSLHLKQGHHASP
jgi:hypothetical protein